jgi:hypothetical protein
MWSKSFQRNLFTHYSDRLLEFLNEKSRGADHLPSALNSLTLNLQVLTLGPVLLSQPFLAGIRLRLRVRRLLQIQPNLRRCG